MKISIEINTAIALCHIIEEYETFRENLRQFSEKNKNHPAVWKDLEQIAQGKIYLGKRKLKKFYQENQKVIDKITNYTSIENFLFYVYATHIIKVRDDFDFYQYLSRNKDKISQILAVLNQIKKLGFKIIILDETNDFTKEEYIIYKDTKKNKESYNNIYFLENLKRIPIYGTEIIKYQSQSSNYKIKFYYSSYTECLIWDNSILLNNLTFDTNLLPTIGNEDSLADSMWEKMITTLTTEKEEECSQLTNAVNLSLGIVNLTSEINTMEKMLQNTKRFQEKEELNVALLQMKVELTRIKQISEEYDREITSNDSSITEDILKRERNKKQNCREYNQLIQCFKGERIENEVKNT